MPIDYKEYHPKWSLISRLIRFRRADNKCEQCGAPNGKIIYRDKKGWHLWPEGMESEVMSLDGFKSTLIVLTVAHMDHDKTNNVFSNLKALCQKCHLHHDRKQHAFNRKYGRKTKYLNHKIIFP